MDSVLLFDVQCQPCSETARRVTNAVGDRLRVAGLRDPWILDLAAKNGISLPDRPALLTVDSDGSVVVHVGFAMRMRLMRMLGFRRAHVALELLTAEVSARVALSTPATSTSRRRVLGYAGFGAGYAFVASWFGQPLAAVASTPPPTTFAPPDRVLTAALASKGMRGAISSHGSITEGSAIESHADGERVIMLRHKSGAVSFVDATSPTADPMVTTVIATVEPTRTLAFYDGGTGAPLGSIAQVRPGDLFVPVEPASSPSPVRVVCFLACISGKVNQGCANVLLECFITANFLSCAYATACAGPLLNKCRKQC